LLQTAKIHSFTKLKYRNVSTQTTPAAIIIKPQIYLLSAQNLKTLFSKEKLAERLLQIICIIGFISHQLLPTGRHRF